MIMRVSICATFRSFQVILIVGVATTESSLSASLNKNIELSRLVVVGLEHMTVNSLYRQNE